MSVLEIIGTATRGGMENHIMSFLKNLPAGKFRITCICPCESLFTKALREVGVEGVYVTPLADNPDWRSIQMAMEVARLHQVDILHAHMPKSHVLAGIAGSLLHKPVVATVHGMHVTAHELGVALAVKSHLVTNCEETYIQALALGVPAERVNLFHNGVDVQAFHPAKSGEKLRHLINVPGSATLIGFVGRLEPDKGPDLFLRSAGHVHELLPDVHFAVVGAGSMLNRLRQMTRQMRLEDHLHFVDWSTDTAEVYPAFDLMAHSSRNDGTSLVVLEAMASGRPVVGMAVGGVREMIGNEHTGMLVEPNDWEALGNQVVRLLEEPLVLKSMGAAARKRVEENFNVSINTRRTADLLYQVALSWHDAHESRSNYKISQALDGNGSLKYLPKRSVE
ncbi:MAG: glycosyltransferase family 1 protein [Ferruginibacter sp.]|nr:glycosyltransferase family 1 protein [Ferruginibacter sp.]